MNNSISAFKKAGLIISITASTLLASQVQAQMAVGKTKFVGNIIADSVPANFSTYWNQVTPENSGKWGPLESSQGNFNWTPLDTAYNFARANGYKFKHHNFVWGSQEPSWIGSLSAANKKAAVENLMSKVCTRYPNIDFIDVVNEPLHAVPSFKDAIGGDGTTGWDWVIWSFEKARQYCPNAKLLINEYGLLNDSNAISKYKTIIALLKTRGLIDGVGMQNHQFNLDDLAASTMKTNLDSLAAAGLPLYSSELDLTGDDATQLARYKEKFPIIYEHASVAGVTLWGYEQGKTWKDNTWLIRSDGTERPALTWMKQYVTGTASSSAASSSVASSRSSSSVASSSVASSRASSSSLASSKPASSSSVASSSLASSKPASSSSSSVASSKPASSSSSSTSAGGKCEHIISSSWNTGFVATIRITNNGTTPINGWNVAWQYSDGSKITSSWNATFSGSNPYSATNLDWNKTIQPGQSAEFGFQGTKGSTSNPTATVTGSVCK